MIKRAGLFLFIFIFLFNCSALSNDKLPVEKAKEVINKQLEIEKFQVDVELTIRAFSGQDSNFDFRYCYQQPDRVHLESEDFVFLPREAVKTLQPDFFSSKRYKCNFIKTKGEFQFFEFIPIDKEEKYRVILQLVPEKLQIKHAEIFFAVDEYQEEFIVEIDYDDIEGYSLPNNVEGELAVPTKFGVGGKIKETTKGSFTLKLSNYEIN